MRGNFSPEFVIMASEEMVMSTLDYCDLNRIDL